MRRGAGVFVRAVLCWLGLFELLAGARGWWGLTWLGRGRARWLLTPLPPLLLAGMRGRRGRMLSLLLAAPVALWAQIAASNRRNAALNPLLRLRPGQYETYAVTRLDIAMRDGFLPALHIVPATNARAVVCVLHGSGCDKTSYIWRMVDMLTDAGLAVLLIDLDGHGENPRPQRFPQIVEDAGAAVAWLRARYARVGMLGISLGGCVAARAVADGLAVDGLALLEAPPALHYTRRSVWREAAALVRPNLLHLFGDCTVQHMAGGWRTAPIRAEIGTHALIVALDLLHSLPRIGVPLLLLYGGSDAIVPPRQAAQVRQVAPPGAQFALVPWASHLTLVLTPAALRLVRAWAVQLAGGGQVVFATEDTEHTEHIQQN